MSFKSLAVLAAALPAAFAQFVTPPTDLKTTTGYAGYQVRYKQVPNNICETNANVKSYSGYVDVAPNEHLFFWFFEARNVTPSKAPLTIWLNGGPGDPSMVGLFSDVGPCGVDYEGNLYNNPYSWTTVSNMIFIDQPTQTGFSYSNPVNAYIDDSTGYTVTVPGNTCPDYAAGTCGTYSDGNYTLTDNSTTNAAPNVWKALQGFMGAFPQYSRNSIHLSTESYGGHYGPVFAEYFETQNAAKISGAVNINLQSLSVGNGWYDPIIQYPSYYNFTVSPGNTFGYKPYNETIEEQVYNLFYGKGNCVDQLKYCNVNGWDEVCSSADNFCYAVESVFDTVTGRDEYDIRELEPDPFPYTFFVDYLNLPKVQKAIGAYTNFSYSVTNLGAGTVANAFGYTGDDARHFNIIGNCQTLLTQGVSILQYAGDADYNCNWLGGEQVALEINAPGWTSAGYQNISTIDKVVHGVVKQSSNFSFARIYDAGHSVPFYKPLVALSMFTRLINGLDIATGSKLVTSSYKSTGPSTSTHQNDPATIQYTVTDPDCTWNPVTNVPQCPGTTNKRAMRSAKRFEA